MSTPATKPFDVQRKESTRWPRGGLAVLVATCEIEGTLAQMPAIHPGSRLGGAPTASPRRAGTSRIPAARHYASFLASEILRMTRRGSVEDARLVAAGGSSRARVREGSAADRSYAVPQSQSTSSSSSPRASSSEKTPNSAA